MKKKNPERFKREKEGKESQEEIPEKEEGGKRERDGETEKKSSDKHFTTVPNVVQQ